MRAPSRPTLSRFGSAKPMRRRTGVATHGGAIAIIMSGFLVASAPSIEAASRAPSTTVDLSTAAPSAPPRVLKRSRTIERDGVRVTVTLERNPLVAGQPVWLRTHVRNLRDELIHWPGAPECGDSVSVRGWMTDAHWRPIELVDAPPREPNGGFVRPVTDLRWWIQDRWTDWRPRKIWLGFAHPSSTHGCGDSYFETRLPPRGTLIQRLRWDGQASGGLGPPPSGPTRIVGTFAYRFRGEPFGRTRVIRVPIDAWIVDGRDPTWLEPMEIVDAALADARLQTLMEQISLGYESGAYVAFDPGREVWVVGTCSSFEGDLVHWRAAIVDPASGAVFEVIDRPGADCETVPWAEEPPQRAAILMATASAAPVVGDPVEPIQTLVIQPEVRGDDAERPADSTQSTWGPLAVIDDPAEGDLDAAGGTGRLVISDRCVVLRADNGYRTTLVWRDGQTTWDADRRQITFRDRDLGQIRLSHGDQISLGGAASDEGPYSGVWELAWLSEPDASCPMPQWVVHQVDFVDG